MDQEPLVAGFSSENQIVNDGAISLSSCGSSRRQAGVAAAPQPGQLPSLEARGQTGLEPTPQSPIDLDPSPDRQQADALASKQLSREKPKPKEGAKKRGRPRLNKKKEPASGKKPSSPASPEKLKPTKAKDAKGKKIKATKRIKKAKRDKAEALLRDRRRLIPHAGQLTNFFRSLGDVEPVPISFPQPIVPEVKLTEEEIMVRSFAAKQ